jgi:DNA-binding response OmpR family regulator
MDISIRGDIGGIEAARQIRSRFKVPIIFVTGYPDREMKEAAKAAEPIAYFIKPLEYTELKAVIDSILRKKQGPSNTISNPSGVEGTPEG